MEEARARGRLSGSGFVHWWNPRLDLYICSACLKVVAAGYDVLYECGERKG